MSDTKRPDETEADRFLAEANVFAEMSGIRKSEPEGFRWVDLRGAVREVSEHVTGAPSDEIARERLVVLGHLALEWILEIDARAKAGQG